MSSLIYVRDTSSNKNVPLEVDASNKLSVSDATSHTTLSSISSSLSGTLSTSDTTAQSSLSAIESSVAGVLSVSDTTAQTSLTSIDTSLSGTLATSDATAQSTLSSINTALAGTLTTSQGVSRTNGNIAVSSSVSNGDVSSSVDANNYKHVIVFGNLGASGDVLIQVSNDNSNWYEDSNSQFWSNSSVYDVAGRFEATARYWRVKYGVSGTVTLRYALSS
tara:strand:- start:461 stop:1120 length:660 start_codon:yes stop_codon:yes gene_type:complete